MSLFTEALTVAAHANLSVFLICAVGALAVYLKFLNGEALKRVAGLMIRLLYPMLTFSMFDAYSAERLARWSPALVVGACHLLLGFALGQLFARLLRLQPQERICLVLTTTFGNCGALPFILSLVVVQRWRRVADTPGALESAYGIIALYASVWILMMFTAGAKYIQYATSSLEAPPAADAKGKAPDPALTLRARVLRRIKSVEPTVAGTVLGIIIGLIPPLKAILGAGGALGFIGGTARVLGDAGITLSTLILGASLQLAAQARLEGRRLRRASLRSFNDVGAVAEPSTAVADEESATRNGGAAHDAPPAAPPPSRLRRCCGADFRLTAAAIVLRLIVLPAVAMPLQWLATRGGVLPDDPVLQIVMYMQAGVPAAQTTVAMLAAAGKTKMAGELSTLYLPQYLVSVFTMAAIIVIAINVIGEEPVAE